MIFCRNSNAMKAKIQIDEKTGIAYISKGLRDAGYVGKVEGIFSTLTVTLMCPRAKLKDIKRSLEITLQDIQLRIDSDGGDSAIEENSEEPE